jgi:tetratricopeptide (TPR) repeat protein
MNELAGRKQVIGAMFDILGHFYNVGDFARMAIIARNTLASVPDDVVSMQFLGLAYLRTGNEQSAVSLFHRAADVMQEQLVRRRHGSSSFEPRGEFSAATRCLAEAAQPNPVLADIWKDVGLKWHELGYPEQASSALTAALQSKPHFPEARAALEALKGEATQRGGVSHPSAG